jgi:hypothetical protein
MTSVAIGSSQFHSSFLPKVAAAARRHGVELRRLLVAMGHLDPVFLDENRLHLVAASLPKAAGRSSRETLTSFSAPGIRTHSISASLSAVHSLVEAMIVTCAKRRARPVIELVASESHSPELLLADLILAEGAVVLGRVVYGSFEMLERVLRATGNQIPLYLDDKDGGPWAADWPRHIKEIVEANRILPTKSKRLFAAYLEDILLAASARYGQFCLMIYGNPTADFLQGCGQIFRHVVVHGELPPAAPENCWQMADFSDRVHFDLGMAVALLLCPPAPFDSAAIDQLLAPEGIIVTAGHFPRFETDLPGRNVLRVDPNHSYRGQIERWASISNLMKSAEPAPLAVP